MIDYELALALAFTAFVYTIILTDTHMILNRPYNWIDIKLNSNWLFKIIVGCERCVAGQWALWVYLFKHFNNYVWYEHIFFTAFTIFIVHFIKQIHNKTQQT